MRHLNYTHLLYFWTVVREGSVTKAAESLHLTPQTVSGQLKLLEQSVGEPLFARAGRGLMLTPAGMELVDHVRAMGEAATRVSLTASGQSQSVEGLVVLTASEVYAAHVLPPLVRRIRHDHPGIELEIVASNAVSDLRRREADIALRNARPTDPDLIARRLRDDAAGLYATPECLARFALFCERITVECGRGGGRRSHAAGGIGSVRRRKRPMVAFSRVP